ncbi:EthD family reductase [Sphingomonas oryzagri]|uniref:EthD family reductase n=1 Tax=Sphingomonas oryzagri TaxID=3042314 RepID=A0ABT6MY21_9SPHN|nr:EthD family reductase [Sphingomonas oryzagri]MDH7637399.1 EthD family reductase [Sphingomonas oryzagri]
MALLFVTYPAGGGSRFDRDYYVATHLPLVEKAWGPSGLRSARAYFPASEGSDPVAVAVLTFAEEAAIGAALASDATAGVLADLANFTDIAPVIQRGTAP